MIVERRSQECLGFLHLHLMLELNGMLRVQAYASIHTAGICGISGGIRSFKFALVHSQLMQLSIFFDFYYPLSL